MSVRLQSTALDNSKAVVPQALIIYIQVMVVTGFEIFGVVTSSLSTLNLARTITESLILTIKEFRDAGAKLHDLNERFSSFQGRLDTWATETWQISETTSLVYYKTIWGADEWQSISNQIRMIDKTCEDVTVLLASLLPEDQRTALEDAHGRKLMKSAKGSAPKKEPQGSVASSSQPSRSLEKFSVTKRYSRKDEAQKLRDLENKAKKAAKFSQKAAFVLKNSSQLNNAMDRLDSMFASVEHDADERFYVQFPNLPRYAPLRDRLEAVRQSLLLERAFGSREASKALYKWCTSSGRADGNSSQTRPGWKDLKIEMGLVFEDAHSKHPAASSTLHFHLLVSWKDREDWQEFAFDGPIESTAVAVDPGLSQHESTAASDANLIEDFASACAALIAKRTQDLRISPSSAFRFRSRHPPSEPIRLSQKYRVTEKCLQNLLLEIELRNEDEKYDEFPISERYDLAYRTVEFGLMLLGTSWLRNFDKKSLVRLRIGAEQRRRFVLEVQAARVTRLRWDQLPNLLGNAPLTLDPSQTSIPEPELFRVGILLVEIALGRPVLRISKHPDNDKICLVFRKDGSPSGYSAWPLRLVVERVTKRGGPDYGMAVEFCLLQFEAWRNQAWNDLSNTTDSAASEEAYRAVLKEYYLRVYLP